MHKVSINKAMADACQTDQKMIFFLVLALTIFSLKQTYVSLSMSLLVVWYFLVVIGRIPTYHVNYYHW